MEIEKDNETIIYPWHSRQFIEEELLRCEEFSLCSPKNYCSIKWGDGTTSWVQLTYFDDGSTEPDTIQSNSHTYKIAGTYTITTDCYFSLFYYSTCHNENCIVDQGHTECDTWCEPSDYTCKGIDKLIEFTE